MNDPDTIYPLNREPRIGLVIGTYAAVPYIHLQLEAWRRLCHDVPLLVVDDASVERPRLFQLCQQYGADFFSEETRRGHLHGDLNGFLTGFEWAQQRKVDLLVKFSRRWIPLIPWQDELVRIARESQFATYSASCPVWGFRFRTEALALHVPSWLQCGALDTIREYSDVSTFSIPEWIFHQSARRVFQYRCPANRRFTELNPSPMGLECCGFWPLMGQGRKNPQASVLWHEWAAPHEYLRALQQWEIYDYNLAGVEDIGDMMKLQKPTPSEDAKPETVPANP